MNANQWASAITKALKTKEDKIPDGWHTREQLQKKFGMTKAPMVRRLQFMKKENLVEQKKFYIKTTGRVCPIIHYKLKK